MEPASRVGVPESASELFEERAHALVAEAVRELPVVPAMEGVEAGEIVLGPSGQGVMTARV